MIPIKTIVKIPILAILIVAVIVPLSGCTICGGAPTPTSTLKPTSTVAPAAESVWDNGNVYAITGSATNPTVVTFSTPVTITYIHTYHWNSAKGATPGAISLKGEDGTVYGPWQATGADGQGGVKNAYWVVRPNVTLKAGAYTIVDSDPSTFATNSQANGVGMAHIVYTPAA